jgi:CelD/BcsL family acetyltransferase involved in cellulose biosynthesis
MSQANPRHARSETTVVSEPEGFAALRQEWRDLWRRCPSATPFQSPEWLMPWWDVFAPGALRVIAVRENGELTALAPLYRDGNALKPIGVSLSDYQDILIAPESRAYSTIASAMAAMRDVEMCAFDEVSPDGTAVSLEIPGWDERLACASPCPQLELPDGAWQTRIPPSTLRHLRTARRRAARRGECVILEGDADNALPLIAELARLNKVKRQDSAFEDPRVEAFHTAALPGLIEQGLVRFYALTIADAVTAVYYGFLHNGRAYAYLGGFDPAFAFESPGAILLAHAIESAAKEGARVFDFLRGDERYKYAWGARDRYNVRYTLTRHHG